MPYCSRVLVRRKKLQAMSNKGEDIKVRVTKGIKAAFVKLGKEDMSGESAHARRAFLEYLVSKGYTMEQLHAPPASSLREGSGGGLVKNHLARASRKPSPSTKKASR